MVFVQCLERISLYTIASGSVVYKFGVCFYNKLDFPGTSRNAISPPYFEIQKIRRKSLGVTSFAYGIFHLLFFLFVEKETNGKKNLGFEKKSGTPVFFCEQEVFLKGKNCLEKTIPMLPAWSWGLHKSQSSGRKRDEHFVWKKRKKTKLKKYTCMWCVFLGCERLVL